MAVKLGGLGMTMTGFAFHDEPEPPSSEQLATVWRPCINTCIEAFGADRCMFESNFPVDKAAYSYAVFWNACKRLAHGASTTEKQALFSGSAARFYRLARPLGVPRLGVPRLSDDSAPGYSVQWGCSLSCLPSCRRGCSSGSPSRTSYRAGARVREHARHALPVRVRLPRA